MPARGVNRSPHVKAVLPATMLFAPYMFRTSFHLVCRPAAYHVVIGLVT